jgi:hypothetical protein
MLRTALYEHVAKVRRNIGVESQCFPVAYWPVPTRLQYGCSEATLHGGT